MSCKDSESAERFFVLTDVENVEDQEEMMERQQYTTIPRYQIDRRWVERYRALVAYDTYWWLGSAGPLTEESTL